MFANTKEGLGFGVGYPIAQDRLWQMDVQRKQTSGRLAEFGIASIDYDYATRSLGYSNQELRDMFDNWVPTDPSVRIKEMMLAYVDGVNQYIEEASEAYALGDPFLIPLEYLPVALDILPIAPWTIEDSIAVLIRNSWRFGRSGGNEYNLMYYLAALQGKYGNELGWDIFNDLFPQVDPGAPVTIPSEGSAYTAFADPIGTLKLTSDTANIDKQNGLM